MKYLATLIIWQGVFLMKHLQMKSAFELHTLTLGNITNCFYVWTGHIEAPTDMGGWLFIQTHSCAKCWKILFCSNLIESLNQIETSNQISKLNRMSYNPFRYLCMSIFF